MTKQFCFWTVHNGRIFLWEQSKLDMLSLFCCVLNLSIHANNVHEIHDRTNLAIEYDTMFLVESVRDKCDILVQLYFPFFLVFWLILIHMKKMKKEW